MKQINPIECALDAYFKLDTDQRAAFAITVIHVERERDRILGRSVDYCKPQDETKRRGRPPGSKNRKPAAVYPTAHELESHELELRHNNGTATEEL